MNPGGAARVVPGQYKAWVMGEYHDRPALREAGELAVQRDPRGTYKRYGPILHGSNFGIHHHDDYGYPRNDLGRSSAGCWVTWSHDDHMKYIALCKSDARYKASHGYKFIGTLLTREDLGPNTAVRPQAAPIEALTDAVSPRHDHVYMTVFAGGDDPERSAYTGERIDLNKVGFSVSYRFSRPKPWVRCWIGEKMVEGPLVDVGPGFTDDPWFLDPNGKPRARNGAGLDATPEVWRQLGISRSNPDYGGIRCSFQLIRPPHEDNWKPRG